MPYMAGQLQAEPIFTSYKNKASWSTAAQCKHFHTIHVNIVLKPLHPTKYKIWQNLLCILEHMHTPHGAIPRQTFYFVSSLISGMGRITKRDFLKITLTLDPREPFVSELLVCGPNVFFVVLFFFTKSVCLPSWYVALASLRHRIHL